jgi:hypothetical protein
MAGRHQAQAASSTGMELDHHALVHLDGNIVPIGHTSARSPQAVAA